MFKKIKQGIKNRQETIALERKLDAALIDPEFLNRAAAGVTPKLAKQLKTRYAGIVSGR